MKDEAREYDQGERRARALTKTATAHGATASIACPFMLPPNAIRLSSNPSSTAPRTTSKTTAGSIVPGMVPSEPSAVRCHLAHQARKNFTDDATSVTYGSIPESLVAGALETDQHL